MKTVRTVWLKLKAIHVALILHKNTSHAGRRQSSNCLVLVNKTKEDPLFILHWLPLFFEWTGCGKCFKRFSMFSSSHHMSVLPSFSVDYDEEHSWVKQPITPTVLQNILLFCKCPLGHNIWRKHTCWLVYVHLQWILQADYWCWWKRCTIRSRTQKLHHTEAEASLNEYSSRFAQAGHEKLQVLRLMLLARILEWCVSERPWVRQMKAFLFRWSDGLQVSINNYYFVGPVHSIKSGLEATREGKILYQCAHKKRVFIC